MRGSAQVAGVSIRRGEEKALLVRDLRLPLERWTRISSQSWFGNQATTLSCVTPSSCCTPIPICISPTQIESGIFSSMFGTIQLAHSTAPDSTPRSARSSRVSKANRAGPVLACTECRRRKTRCDGGQPCQRCDESGAKGPCIYLSPKPRTIVSQKYVNSLHMAAITGVLSRDPGIL